MNCRCDYILQRLPVFSVMMCKIAAVKRELRLILMVENTAASVFSTNMDNKSVIILVAHLTQHPCTEQAYYILKYHFRR